MTTEEIIDQLEDLEAEEIVGVLLKLAANLESFQRKPSFAAFGKILRSIANAIQDWSNP